MGSWIHARFGRLTVLAAVVFALVCLALISLTDHSLMGDVVNGAKTHNVVDPLEEGNVQLPSEYRSI